MIRPKKRAPMSIAEADVEFKKSVDVLTEAIVEDLAEGYHSELEPFDAYAQRVRAQIHSNVEDFRNRFLEGYEVLLQELATEDKSNTIQDKPPPGTIIM